MKAKNGRPDLWGCDESSWCRVIGKGGSQFHGTCHDTFEVRDIINDVWVEILTGCQKRKKPAPERALGCLKKSACRAACRSKQRYQKRQHFVATVSEERQAIFGSLSADTLSNDPVLNAVSNEEQTWLSHQLGNLDPRERDAVMAKFEFQGARSFRELASLWHLTEERVRQLAKSGIQRLRPVDYEEHVS